MINPLLQAARDNAANNNQVTKNIKPKYAIDSEVEPAYGDSEAKVKINPRLVTLQGEGYRWRNRAAEVAEYIAKTSYENASVAYDTHGLKEAEEVVASNIEKANQARVTYAETHGPDPLRRRDIGHRKRWRNVHAIVKRNERAYKKAKEAGEKNVVKQKLSFDDKLYIFAENLTKAYQYGNGSEEFKSIMSTPTFDKVAMYNVLKTIYNYRDRTGNRPIALLHALQSEVQYEGDSGPAVLQGIMDIMVLKYKFDPKGTDKEKSQSLHDIAAMVGNDTLLMYIRMSDSNITIQDYNKAFGTKERKYFTGIAEALTGAIFGQDREVEE